MVSKSGVAFVLIFVFIVVLLIGLILEYIAIFQTSGELNALKEKLYTEIIVVEEHHSISGKPGEGLGVSATCPEKYKAISGGCAMHTNTGLVWRHSQLIKTNENFMQPNAWECGFGFVKEGTYSVSAMVNCETDFSYR